MAGTAIQDMDRSERNDQIHPVYRRRRASFAGVHVSSIRLRLNTSSINTYQLYEIGDKYAPDRVMKFMHEKQYCRRSVLIGKTRVVFENRVA